MKTWLTPDGFVGDDPASKRNARWLFSILLLLVLLMLLAACSTHKPYTPPPLPAQPPGWFPPGCGDFNFSSNATGYCTDSSIRPRMGQTLRMTYTVTGDVSLLKPSDVNDIPPVTISLFIWRNGDDVTCIGQMQQYRWWSSMNVLTAGTHTITAKLSPEFWTDCYGKRGTDNPALFEAAINDPRGIGFTTGGSYFAGHGIVATGPGVHFKVDSFTVESLTKKRKHRRRP